MASLGICFNLLQTTQRVIIPDLMGSFGPCTLGHLVSDTAGAMLRLPTSISGLKHPCKAKASSQLCFQFMPEEFGEFRVNKPCRTPLYLFKPAVRTLLYIYTKHSTVKHQNLEAQIFTIFNFSPIIQL